MTKFFIRNVILGFLSTSMVFGISVDIAAQQDKSPSPILKQAPKRNTDAPPPPPAPQAKDEVFKVVEQMPRFPGCENQNLIGRELELCAKDKLFQYIGENLVYPESAKKNGIEGTVVIQFIVGKDGSILAPRIIRDIATEKVNCNNCKESCGQAALKVFKKMQSELKWITGNQGGKPMKVEYTMPVQFKY